MPFLRAFSKLITTAICSTALFTAMVGVETANAEHVHTVSTKAAPMERMRPTRLAPRAEMSLAEREALVIQLRELYTQPPEQWPKPTLDPDVQHRELGLLPKVVHPEANPGTKAKIKLGKQLFFDPRLSGSGQIACASCHDPDLGWSDGRTTSFGHDRTPLARNSPTIQNSAFRKAFFWDGRATSLEDQAHQVMHNADEMHSSAEVVLENLEKIEGYVTQFQEVFGEEGLTPDNVFKALAAFERSVVGGKTRFDAFLRGRPRALKDNALIGLHLFRTNARCLNCHNGPNFTDDKFHNIGLSRYGRPFEDLGRYRVTNNAEDVGKFRTPSLRNIAKTAPYMHNGLFDLEELLSLYISGMPNERPRRGREDDPLFPTKSPHVKSLDLNEQDRADLTAFLHSLSEPHVLVRPPKLPQ